MGGGVNFLQPVFSPIDEKVLSLLRDCLVHQLVRPFERVDVGGPETNEVEDEVNEHDMGDFHIPRNRTGLGQCQNMSEDIRDNVHHTQEHLDTRISPLSGLSPYLSFGRWVIRHV